MDYINSTMDSTGAAALGTYTWGRSASSLEFGEPPRDLTRRISTSVASVGPASRSLADVLPNRLTISAATESTPLVSEVASAAGVDEVDLHQSNLRTTSVQRSRILALKYVNRESVSNELSARLQILNDRLNALSPRVSASQMESLERIAGLLELSGERQATRTRLLASR